MSISTSGFHQPSFTASHPKSASYPLPNRARVSYREINPKDALKHSKRTLTAIGGFSALMIPGFLSESIHSGLNTLAPKIAQKIESVSIGNGFMALSILGLFATSLVNRRYIRKQTQTFTTNIDLKTLKKTLQHTHQA